MIIRHCEYEDLNEVMDIYAQARQFMKDNGNPRQWYLRNWPPLELIQKDIQERKSYVLIENKKIKAVFFFDYGKDVEPTYSVIEDGHWLSDTPYGVVHRIATKEHTSNLGTICIQWALSQCHHLRMDTHPDNTIMQHVLKDKLHFSYCGNIHVYEDSDIRYAYEIITEEEECIN